MDLCNVPVLGTLYNAMKLIEEGYENKVVVAVISVDIHGAWCTI